MGRKVAVVYTVFSVIAFIVLVSWLAYAFFQTRADNSVTAASTFDDFKSSSAIALSAGGSFDSAGFRTFVHSLFLQDPTVDVLAVSTRVGQVQYILARHASQILAPSVSNGLWSGSIRYSKITQHMFSGTLPVKDRAGILPFRIRAVFTVVDRADLYSIARVLLICLLSFVILTGMVIVIVPMLGPRTKPGPSGAQEEESRGRPEAASPAEETVSSSRVGEQAPQRGRSDRTEVAEEPGVTNGGVIPLGPPPGGPQELTEPPAVAEPAESFERADETPTARSQGVIQSVVQPLSAVAPEPTLVPEEPLLSPAPPEGSRPAPETQASEGLTEAKTPFDDVLPPGVNLPSLEEVGGEQQPELEAFSEIAIFPSLESEASQREPSEPSQDGAIEIELLDEEVANDEEPAEVPEFEITEVEKPGQTDEGIEREPPGYHSAERELADIEDFEDLEELDGSRSPETPELPKPRPRPVSPAPEPTALPQEEEGVDLEVVPEPLTIDEGAAEVEELQSVEGDDDSSPEISGEPADQGPPQSSAPMDDDMPPTVEPGYDETKPSTGDVGESHVRELFNPESGLAWQDHLEQRLSFELDRAASFDQDLALCVVRFPKQPEDVARLNYASEIRTYFPFHDLCFEYGKDAFAIVLPNMDIDQAIRSMENFSDKMNEEQPGASKMFFGLSARNGRLLGSERLLSEAVTAVGKAREDGKSAIFALRVDPGKYREYIKSSLK